MRYGACIVETRTTIDLQKIIDEHMEMLPSEWGLAAFTSASNIEKIQHIYPDGHVLPISRKSFGINEYNRLLASKEFWYNMPFDKVLIFQHDSKLLRKGIEEFLEWDYIGAPWPFQERGGNGGLSLRSKDAMLKVIERFPYYPSQHGNEDCYFSNLVEAAGGKLAPRDVCERFSCETVFKLGTLGYHAIEKYLDTEHVEQVLKQYRTA